MPVMNLLQHMEELVSAHRLLLEVAEQRRQMLLRHDADGLAACYREELGLLERIAGIQSDWEVSAAEYMRARRAEPSGAMTIDVIVELLPDGETKHQLLQSRTRLVEILSEIKKVNNSNQQLIERTLDHIDYIIELHHTGGEQDVTYYNPAAKYPSAANMTKRFESRA